MTPCRAGRRRSRPELRRPLCWSAFIWRPFRGALFLAARWAGVLAAMARFGAAGQSWATLALLSALIGLVVYLLFRAGRALSANGRTRSRWGWIALATVAFLAPRFSEPR